MTSALDGGASRWVLGYELEERVGPLRERGASGPVDEARARRRLERWRKQEPLNQAPLWALRLRAAGITEAELHTLLGEPTEALRSRMGEAPPWQREVDAAYEAPVAGPFAWPEVEGAPPPSPFLALVEPLVQRAHTRLVSALAGLTATAPGAPFEAGGAARALLGHLPVLLLPLVGRVLVVELQGAQLEGRLAGDTPEARYQDFAHQLRRREVALEILARYPVLARHCVERIRQWEAAGLELMERLARDAPLLWRRFHGGTSPGPLVEARGGLSDPHRGGRGVFLLRFASGLKLAYKPHPLAAEVAFQRLVSWLNERGFAPPLRTLEVLDAGDHGWMEYVQAAPCASAEEVRRFYLRQGGYVALLYVLDGTDIHHENLIAAGEHPVLVDLETLFHPHVLTRSLRDVEQQPGTPLGATVLKSGLLPQRFWSSRSRAGVDLSALGARAGQLSPQAYLVTAERGTDRMRFERRQMEIPGADNHPRVEGQEVSLLDHERELAEGFSRMYGLLASHRDALLAPGGPLDAFADAPVRVIFRNTASYGTLLYESLHPHALGDALERQRFFDNLWRGVTERPYLASLVPLELEELLRGDVPHFTTRPGSRDLWTGTGRHLPGFFEDSGLERTRRRLERLSDVDHERQRWVLQRSLDMVRLSSGPRSGRRAYPFQEAGEPARPEALLLAARRIGERLVDLSHSGPGQAHWLSLEFAEQGGWQLAQAGTDLYQGLPGLALFLAWLGSVTGEERFTLAARSALRSLDWQLEVDPSRVRGIGILNGWGGLIYTLTHLGALWRDPWLLDTAELFAERLPARVEEDLHLDLGAGSAGCILALLALAGQRPSPRLLGTARACGERLLAQARPQARGVGWVSRLAGDRVLAGLSHGAAGIALALLRLGAATGEARFRETALEGLEYERGLYSAEERNWPDLRADPGVADGHGEGDSVFMWAWCHGAPGIGLARVAGLGLLDDARVRGEIAVAVDSTLARGFGLNHSLCHGDLGNALFLLEAARALGDEALRERTYRVAGGILESISRHGYMYGLQQNTETPGLMVGLAGLGYGLLRLAAPERVPDVLSVAPPEAPARGVAPFRA